MANEPRPNKAAAIGDDCVPAVFTELSQITGPLPFKPLVHT
jgi:hypothetical protein